MKYYSDVTEKVYDSTEELEKAEKAVEEKKAEEANKLAAISKEKKELANAIDVADKALDEAYKELDVAREKARELQKKHLKELEDLLHPAEEAVKAAQKNKYEALNNFNRKYGALTTTYTGAKAAEEMSRALKYFDDIFDHFFF